SNEAFNVLGGIAVDSAGNAYVTGDTISTNFPTTQGVFQPSSAGFQDAFVTKLNATGNALVYSTYLGGSGGDAGLGIAVDPSGNACIVGATLYGNFRTANALQPNLGGSQDAFVAKVNPTGSALIYSTYLGGGGSDAGNRIAVDSAGNVYAGGGTGST